MRNRSKAQLLRETAVLLFPQADEQFGPEAGGLGAAVQRGMAGAAEGGEQFRPVLARPSVVDDDAGGSATDAAGAAVARESPVAVAAEAALRAPAREIAAPTEAGDGRRLAAGAEEPGLDEERHLKSGKTR